MVVSRRRTASPRSSPKPSRGRQRAHRDRFGSQEPCSSDNALVASCFKASRSMPSSVSTAQAPFVRSASKPRISPSVPRGALSTPTEFTSTPGGAPAWNPCSIAVLACWENGIWAGDCLGSPTSFASSCTTRSASMGIESNQCPARMSPTRSSPVPISTTPSETAASRACLNVRTRPGLKGGCM